MTKRIDIYPLTIIADRYSGKRSGGKFTAWNEEYDMLHYKINGSKCDSKWFWDFYNKNGMKNSDGKPLICGKGNTIEQAYNDLLSKLREANP